MMKRWICAFFGFFLLLSASARAQCDVSARCAFLYEPRSGAVLYEKNADERMLIASTTKIMTALVTIERCDLDESVRVKPEHAAVEGSSMYLKPGGDYTVRDLLYGLMLVSGNDAAAALADHVAGSMERFAGLMNERASEMGLADTHFENAHGLDAEGHCSTARELAIMTAEAMKNDTFCEIFSSKTYSANGINYVNHNKLLTTCEGCLGGKTGYTERAGRILVSCAERSGMRLICVTISDPDDWRDHTSLYDDAFSRYRFVPAVTRRTGSISVVSGLAGVVGVQAEPGGVVCPVESKVTVSTRLPRFVFAPVRSGERAGETVITVDGEKTEIPLSYAESVLMDGSVPLTPWERLKRAWYISGRYGVYYAPH